MKNNNIRKIEKGNEIENTLCYIGKTVIKKIKTKFKNQKSK